MKKRGVSPIIATVLLIALVIVIAMIVFLWARGFISENVEKFGRAVELSCDDVVFEAGYFGGDIDVKNIGDVPIYGFEVKKIGKGDILTSQYVSDNTLSSGNSLTIENVDAGSATELNVVPVILGETSSGKVAYTCPDEYGYTVPIA